MCGITGYYCFKNANEFTTEFNQAINFLKHRGPDNSGIEITEFAAFGHTRLSIIDLSDQASQPMVSEDENFIISFNGEIYNYENLRKRLELRGAKFKTKSDTEVVLRGFELHGDGIFELLQGMFAVAIYYKKEKQLFLARDRFGIKPLYYYSTDDHFFFASEMGALLEYPIPRKLNHESLTNYFRYNYIPGNGTIIEGVKQVKPGEYLIIDKAGIAENKYYQIKRNNLKLSYKEALERIHQLLDLAVRERLMADVPVASFLSGGIDSSIVSMIAAKHQPGIQTYSVGFPDHPFFDESEIAKEFAAELNTNHHIFNLSANEISKSAEDILNGFSEPFADTSAIAYHLLAKQTSKQVKVVLSGDGADEVFGGYRKHKAEWLMQNNKLLAKLSGAFGMVFNEKNGSRNSLSGNKYRQIKKWIDGAGLSNEDRYLTWASIQTENELEQLLNQYSPSPVFNYLKIESINDVLETDMKMVLPCDMLTKADRMGMQYGLEIRTPFLDHYLVDFVFSLPSKWKLKGGVGKRLLKDAFKTELPDNMLSRKKKGLEVPIWAWLNGPLKDLMFSLLSNDQLNKSGLFSHLKVEQLIKQTLSNNPGDAPSTIWALMVFQVWFNKYKPEI